MIVRIRPRGKSFKGATLYYAHDKREPGEAVRLTSERVTWSETHNLANEDPEQAWREMWHTARDQKELKRAAGLRTSGNQVREPVLPIILSWAEPDKPSPEHQRQAAHQFLRRMGWDKHQALIFAHHDTEHQHVHILLNRVNPDNGLVLEESFSHRHAQAWALQYQREHGQEWCPQREINSRLRAEGHPTLEPAHEPYPLAKDATDAHAPALEAEQDLVYRAHLDKDLLSKHQQQEREAFLADGLTQIRGIRTEVFLEVRTEFKPQWRALHAAERAADHDPDKLLQLAEDRRELWAEVRATTRERQDGAVQEFIAERKELFRDLKERQRDERVELREIIAAREAGAPVDQERLAELTGERADPAALAQAADEQLRTANDNPQLLGHELGPVSDLPTPVRDPVSSGERPPPRDVGDGLAGGIGAAAEKLADILSDLISPPSPLQVAINKLIGQRIEAARPNEELERLARRVEEMRREDEQRSARDRDPFGRERDGFGRERERDR